MQCSKRVHIFIVAFIYELSWFCVRYFLFFVFGFFSPFVPGPLLLKSYHCLNNIHLVKFSLTPSCCFVACLKSSQMFPPDDLKFFSFFSVKWEIGLSTLWIFFWHFCCGFKKSWNASCCWLAGKKNWHGLWKIKCKPHGDPMHPLLVFSISWHIYSRGTLTEGIASDMSSFAFFDSHFLCLIHSHLFYLFSFCCLLSHWRIAEIFMKIFMAHYCKKKINLILLSASFHFSCSACPHWRAASMKLAVGFFYPWNLFQNLSKPIFFIVEGLKIWMRLMYAAQNSC